MSERNKDFQPYSELTFTQKIVRLGAIGLTSALAISACAVSGEGREYGNDDITCRGAKQVKLTESFADTLDGLSKTLGIHTERLVPVVESLNESKFYLADNKSDAQWKPGVDTITVPEACSPKDF